MRGLKQESERMRRGSGAFAELFSHLDFERVQKVLSSSGGSHGDAFDDAVSTIKEEAKLFRS